MKSFAEDKIEVYVGPTELGAADNLEQAIVDFIAGARKSLDLAVQEIDSMPIAEALLNARWRGVSINVFVEQDYIRTKLEKVPPPPTPDAASGETQAEAIYRAQWRSDQEAAEEDLAHKRESLAINRVTLSALLRNGIEVKGDFNPKIFHQKFIVRDYRGKAQPTSALLTGSANFTHHDTHDNSPAYSRQTRAAHGPRRRGASRAGRRPDLVCDLHLQRLLGDRRSRAAAPRSDGPGRGRARRGP